MSHRHFANWKNSCLWALLVLAQLWYWSRLFTTTGSLAHSDLYEYFLPVFRSPFTTWSSAEFGGLPAFADPQNATWYPLQLLFGRALGSWSGSWSGYIVSAYIVAGLGAGAYAWQLTRSRAAAVATGLAWPWSEALASLFPHLAFLHAFAWLPWILFGIEKILERPRASWVGATAVFFACSVLAGNPQASVYCSYLIVAYLVLGWLVSSRSMKTLACLVAPLALGGVIAAVQIIPTFDASTWIARSQVGFSQFAASNAKQAYDLMTIVVPQACHEHRETPTYVGVLTLALAVAGALAGARDWRVWFWLAIAAVCLMLGLGSATPVASLAYALPLYDKFRIVARHLYIYSFSLIVLGALGLGAIRAGRLTARRTLIVAAVFTVCSLGALMFARARPDLYDMSCGVWASNEAVARLISASALQGGFIALAGALVALTVVPAWRPFLLAAIPVVLAVDLLDATGESVDSRGYEPPSVIDARLLEPSVHAVRLRDELAPAHQRFLQLGGSATDPLVPGAFARLWSIPSLGGYNPFLPGRIARLIRIGANGATPPLALFDDDQALDVMAVRYVTVRAEDLDPARALPAGARAADLRFRDRNGSSDSSILIGPANCRARGPMRWTLAVPPVDISAVIVVSHLTCGDNVAADALVGNVIVRGDSRADAIPMHAGRPEASGTQGMVRVANRDIDHQTSDLAAYRVPLPSAWRARTITIETAPMRAALAVDGIAVVVPDGRVLPLQLPGAALNTTSRWREHARFRTSRETDRGVDEAQAAEAEYVVLENLRARPRAWFAGTVVDLDDDFAIETIRFGRLVDGSTFDSAGTALVPPGTSVSAGGGTGQVTFNSIADGRFDLGVDATSPGLVVVSELHHPGWRAWVDGHAAPVERADYAVMGVAVPSGQHNVVLEFRARSLKLGAAVSLAGCVVMMLCFVSPEHRWREWRRWSRARGR